ncbi:MAG TPA: WecB/TagA/CpsF family glycosyltransferase [Blastocatellia bacterium]|nr:WecB/TagA/CpsF family glycosyltransferase [Blastocatellia bacterium]
MKEEGYHLETSGPSSRSSFVNRSQARRVTLCGIPVDDLSEDETVAAIDRLIASGAAHHMTVVNAAKIVAASRDEELRQAILESSLVTADGMSVVWASRLLGARLRGRVTGIDMFERLVEHAAGRGLRVYLLGAREPSVRGTVERLIARHPSLIVAGWRDGYFAPNESETIAREIRESRADILFVARGTPAQEKWIRAYIKATGARFALGVGGSFDHVSGLARRAPVFLQRAGLEWLYRLAREPRRLWRRYLVGNTTFIWLVAKQAAMMRFGKRSLSDAQLPEEAENRGAQNSN